MYISVITNYSLPNDSSLSLFLYLISATTPPTPSTPTTSPTIPTTTPEGRAGPESTAAEFKYVYQTELIHTQKYLFLFRANNDVHIDNSKQY